MMPATIAAGANRESQGRIVLTRIRSFQLSGAALSTRAKSSDVTSLAPAPACRQAEVRVAVTSPIADRHSIQDTVAAFSYATVKCGVKIEFSDVLLGSLSSRHSQTLIGYLVAQPQTFTAELTR